MANEKKKSKGFLRKIAIKALKAAIKTALFYGIYLIVSMFLAPISEIVPSLQQTIEIFVMIYILLMIIGEFTSGTIYQHFFNAARALFVILYMILTLRGGVVGLTFQNIDLIVDLRFFLMVAMILSLLGFTKSTLQAINFLNEKAQYPRD